LLEEHGIVLKAMKLLASLSLLAAPDPPGNPDTAEKAMLARWSATDARAITLFVN
jgi:hypothetical protein